MEFPLAVWQISVLRRWPAVARATLFAYRHDVCARRAPRVS
jgi:hypothetical protein